MKNVIILGAGGQIARHVIDILVKHDINLTLFLRDKSRLLNHAGLAGRAVGEASVIETGRGPAAIASAI
jgi:saccharopine dehydrogenase-like NADP-dependent oxidoreductase